MKRPSSYNTLDALCTTLKEYAAISDRLINSGQLSDYGRTVELSQLIASVRSLLEELYRHKRPQSADDKTMLTINRLIARYEELEGKVKEIRNDLQKKRTAAE